MNGCTPSLQSFHAVLHLSFDAVHWFQMAARQFFPSPRSAPLRRGPRALPPAALRLLLIAAGGGVSLAERGGAVFCWRRHWPDVSAEGE